MNRMRRVVFLGVALCGVALTPSGAGGAVSDQQVAQAIERIKQFLYDKQDTQTGSWEFRSQQGGIKRDVNQFGAETAMVTYALLVSGESFQNPKLAKAIEFLRQIGPIGTYAVSVRAHVWACLPSASLSMLDQDATWLMHAADGHPEGLFYYQPGQTTAFIDNGVVQYGVLGLWEATKRGYKIPRKYWENWLGHFLRSQRPDGNWTYAAGQEQVVGGAGSGNIFDSTGIGDAANAGLAALLIIQQELFRSLKTPHPQTYGAIGKGLDWLDQHFDLTTGNSGYNHYYLFGIERIAAACGVRYLNDQDWYQAGAAQIINDIRQMEVTQFDSLQMAFALMFLSRGRYPVWIAKLKLPGIDWNNRPNDLYFLNLYLSDRREGELNWQVIDLDKGDPTDWLMSPVLYLSSDQAFELDDRQLDRLKGYLNRGGLLVTCAEDRSGLFSASVRRMAKRLYPRYPIEPMKSDDPFWDSWLPKQKGFSIPVLSVSNGARHLILSVEDDWGYPLQAGDYDGSPAATFASNLFAYATGRGVPRNRLDALYQKRQDRRATTGEIRVGCARYDGHWRPEPAMWTVFAEDLFNRAGKVLTATSDDADALGLDQIGGCDMDLVHLCGVDAVRLTPAELEAVRRYVDRGGTLLIETVGGRGAFGRSVTRQLAQLFDTQPVPLGVQDAIVSGQGIVGGYDCRRAAYRRFAAVSADLEPVPRLTAFFDSHDRPRVIVSDLDLTIGVLGSEHWGVFGYQRETSRQLMTNIVLWASQESLAPPAP